MQMIKKQINKKFLVINRQAVLVNQQMQSLGQVQCRKSRTWVTKRIFNVSFVCFILGWLESQNYMGLLVFLGPNQIVNAGKCS